ncbi:MAG: ATP-binding protein [Candidatus Nezhaarchaeota archaeon]|nr:ATP-binding protein [Candidatus Nezhaarchaeota archaeon]
MWFKEASFISYLPPTLIKLGDGHSSHHVFVFGMTGSGKTNSVKRIVGSRWIRRPVLVLDWAGEYGDLGFEEVRPEQVSMEGLRPIDVVDAFSSAYQLTRPQEAFLLRCLKGSSKIKEVAERIEEYPVKSSSEVEIKEALLRRLEILRSLNIFEGKVGVKELLLTKARLNLSELPYEARRLAVNIILRLVYNVAPEAGGGILVIEEAENVIPARRFEAPPSSGEIILNELRKWNFSIIAVAQLPSQVSIDSFRNCEYILIHRVRLTPLETSWLGLSEEEAHKLARLRTGELLLIQRGRKKWLRVPTHRARGRIENYEEARRPNRSIHANEVSIEVLEGGVEVLRGKLEALEEEVKDVKSLILLLPSLSISREEGLIIIRERGRLEESEVSLVKRALKWLGGIEEVVVEGRRCWFIRRDRT